MNTPTLRPPRFTCRLVRSWIAVTGRTGSRHAATCRDCQQYFAACDRLESSLRSESGHQQQSVPAGLEQRILQAVNRSAAPRRQPVLSPFALALSAAAALALVIFLLPRLAGPGKTPDVAVAPPADATVVAAEATTPPAWDTLLPKTQAILRQNPLQDEMANVVTDAKSAMNFLVLNFTPTAPAPSGRTDTAPGSPSAKG